MLQERQLVLLVQVTVYDDDKGYNEIGISLRIQR